MTRDTAASTETPPVAGGPGTGPGPLDTFPKLLQAHARQRPNQPAMREKDYGIWQSWSWADTAAEGEALAAGLKGLGCPSSGFSGQRAE
jgi:long-subunit acyl-CoA synthetase (AMP-forming)